MAEQIKLRCPRCGKKAGRAVKGGRVCLNCGYLGTLEEYIEQDKH